MGALASNLKRSGDNEHFNHKNKTLYSNPLNFILCTKRPRFSIMDKSSNDTASIISRYPDSKPRGSKEVQAPVRHIKFGLSISNSDNRGDLLSSLSHRLNNAKKQAFGSLRYFNKEKEVVSVEDDDEEEKEKEFALNYCSVEEVDVTEIRKSNVEEHERNFQASSSNGVIELDNESSIMANVFDKLSLNHEDVSDIEMKAYEKLLMSSERRNNKLKDLDFRIELNENRRAALQAWQPEKKPEEQEEATPHEPFVPLTKEEIAEVYHAFSAKNKKMILVSHENSSIDIRGEVLQCLKQGSWLNDEVINLYLELLKERENREPKKFLKCHFFNTFFYKKLVNSESGYNYKAVKRWTSQRKLGYCLYDCDKIFIPIHKDIHWCLAVINNKDQKFQYLDSLRGRDGKVLNALANYFVEEVADKSGKDIDISSWEREYVDNLPAQKNGFDCGTHVLFSFEDSQGDSEIESRLIGNTNTHYRGLEHIAMPADLVFGDIEAFTRNLEWCVRGCL